jgi:hypothetical protein
LCSGIQALRIGHTQHRDDPTKVSRELLFSHPAAKRTLVDLEREHRTGGARAKDVQFRSLAAERGERSAV